MSGKVLMVMEEFTPFIEQVSIDEAFLDVTASRRLFGEPAEIARRIKEEIRRKTGLTASVGVAPNKFLAKLGSEMSKPDGLMILPFDEETIRKFLQPLEISRLYGVGKATMAMFQKNGIFTIGDLQKADEQILVAMIGRSAAADFKKLAEGIDDRPVESQDGIKSISREFTFDEDCQDHNETRKILLELVDDVGRQLRESSLHAVSVQIKIRWSDFTTITRQKTMKKPVCDDFSLRHGALDLWEKEALKAPIRLVGFGVSKLTSADVLQLELPVETGARSGKQEELSRTVDRLKEKFGDKAVTSAYLMKKKDEK